MLFPKCQLKGQDNSYHRSLRWGRSCSSLPLRKYCKSNPDWEWLEKHKLTGLARACHKGQPHRTVSYWEMLGQDDHLEVLMDGHLCPSGLLSLCFRGKKGLLIYEFPWIFPLQNVKCHIRWLIGPEDREVIGPYPPETHVLKVFVGNHSWFSFPSDFPQISVFNFQESFSIFLRFF